MLPTVSALEVKTDILSRWRRKFTPDEIKSLAIDLQSLIDIATKEANEKSFRLQSMLSSAWKEVETDPEMSRIILRHLPEAKEAGVNLVEISDIKYALEKIARYYWLGLDL